MAQPDPRSPKGNRQQNGGGPAEPGFNWKGLVLVSIAIGLFILAYVFKGGTMENSVAYPQFKKALEDGQILNEPGKSIELVSEPGTGTDYLKFYKKPSQPGAQPEQYKTQVNLQYNKDLMWMLEDKYHLSVTPKTESNVLLNAFLGMTPILAFLLILYFFFRQQIRMAGKGALNFGKSKARMLSRDKNKITFKDVAGVEEAKEEVTEIVEFLRDPKKFQKLGGRIPKGVLMVGSPGTGKTLLARAIAGEADVPFFSISGSDFVEMFVGVGASRVRDMFEQGKKSAPCLIFIDEIDAVGRHRGHGMGGGHDEREQTLNQILSEMDGFSPNESVIVLAATNRPDVLDPALLRPGRFDRHVTVDRPNLKGREAIFKVHCRNVPLADDLDLHQLASGTVGLTGADIRNLVNEAALWATRQGKDKVQMADFEIARDKILMGPKREEVLNEKEKHMTAYHEAGHALLAWVLPG
ncbi:MAG TPA: ATP-dependent zinc metalloprotease FtsH, partial [Chthoniobacter sp.]